MGRWAALVASAFVASCGGTSVPHASSTESAVIVAPAAAVLHVAGGGCKIAGCTAGLTCNRATELCEPVPCGPSGCPVGTTCEVDRCVAR
jgi:hypothetical protein